MRRLALLACLLLAACGGGDDGDGEIAVLAAFPAELAAVLAHVAVEETLTLDGRLVRRGRLAGRPVVVAMTGIGLVNAEQTTRLLLDRFAVRGVVMAGVAGSPLGIAEVAVAERWWLPDDGPFAVHPAWLALARRLAGADLGLARCTSVPEVTPEPVCMPHVPALHVGGDGESDDSFAGAFPCRPGAGEVFGCDPDEPPRAAAARAAAAVGPVVDMESAAVARQAARAGLPFIAFRGVSDGSGDPLDLPGFPQQFFAYYRLAAHNAAAAVAAFVGRL